jgi:hypothetical protein
MKIQYSQVIAVLVILIGFGIIAAALFSQPQEFQIAMVLAGLAFVFSGYIQIAQAQDKKEDEKRNEERHQKLMEKLEKIEQLGEKLEQPRNTGVAIADVISSGLKYYAEHLGQQKEDKQDD